MATMIKAGLCQEKLDLIEAFLAAAKELVAVHNEQAKALIDGDPDFGRFDVVIHAATDRKRQAKYDYLAHLEKHGC
jgi:hypothetical protein